MNSLPTIVSLSFVILSSIFFIEILEAQPNFKSYHDARYGFELEYPSSLLRLESSSNEIPLALRSQEGFPTFNILLQAGQRNKVPGLSFCEHIVADYRKVGLTDASLTATLEPASEYVHSICGVSYTHTKIGPMTSWAAIVDQADSFYLLTLVGKERTLAKEYKRIFSSFTPEQPRTPEKDRPKDSSELYWIFFGAFWLLAILIYLMMKRKKSA